MRCDECKVEPLTPGHYCECCGRKLSLQERRALESQAAPPADSVVPTNPGHVAHAAPVDRLVGVHFPVPSESASPVEAPAPVKAATPASQPNFYPEPSERNDEPVARPNVDPVLEAHFEAFLSGVFPPVPAPSTEPTVVEPIHADEPHDAVHAAKSHDDVPSGHLEDVHSAHVEHVPSAHVEDVPSAHGDSDAPPARCESCGGHTDEGELCNNCQHAFHSLLESATPEVEPEPVSAAAPPVATEPPPVVAALVESVPAAELTTHVPAVRPAAAPVPAPQQLDAPQRAPIGIKPIVPPAPASPEAPVAKAAPRKKPKPVAPSSPKSVAPVVAAASPAPQSNRTKQLGGALAVLVAVAALGFPLSQLLFGGQEAVAIVVEEAPSEAPAPAADASAPAVVPVAAAVTEPVAPAPAPDPTPAPAVAPATHAPATKTSVAAVRPPQPKPTAKPTAKPGRQPVAARPTATVAAAPAPAPVVAAPEVVAPAPVVAPEPKPEPPAAPVGPFFETRDVNEAPKVTTRVEPIVPDDLRDRQFNEVVIVRVLVTQAGQPMIVNLLRKSKSGASLDNAIVNAVKQWTFAPARRRGEPVSCWYHVGVPVSKAN